MFGLASFFVKIFFPKIYLHFTCKHRPTEVLKCAKYLGVNMTMSECEVILSLTATFSTAHIKTSTSLICSGVNKKLFY